MSTVECQFCGARLVLPDGDAPDEVRCRRCGRRTKVGKQHRANARPSEQRARPGAAVPPAPTVRRAAPPEFEALPRPAPKVDAYPRQATPPPPLPIDPGRTTGTARIAMGIAAAVAVAVTVALMMYGGTTAPDPGQSEPGGAAQYSAKPPPPSPGPDLPDGATMNTDQLPPTIAMDPKPEDPTAMPAPQPATGPAPADQARGGTGLAAQILVEPLFNEEIFANSELALAKLDSQRLKLPEAAQSRWFLETFPPPVAQGDLHDAFKTVVWADFALKEDWLYRNRPSFAVKFSNAPAGTRIRIRLLVQNASAKNLLTSSQATESEWITLDKESHPGVVWFEDAKAPGQQPCWEVGLQPMWDAEQLASLARPQQLNFELQVTYADGSEDDRTSKRITVLPVSHVELTYPLCPGFIGLVNPSHPWITQIVNEVSQCSLARKTGAVVGGGSDPSDAMFGVFLVWRELRARGLRYQSLTGTSEPGVQVARSIHDSLTARNANCVDGSILMCSFLEAMALDSMMLYPPGHAMVAFNDGETWWELETTRLGSDAQCSAEWLEEVLNGLPRLRDLAAGLAGEDRIDFLNFVGALEGGYLGASQHFTRVKDGDSEAKLPSVSDLVRVYQDNGKSTEERMGAAMLLNDQFMKICPIDQARAAGIKPIPLPQDLGVPLPAQPIRTR